MQTTRSVSFLNHLLVIQQMQREAAYGFAKHLKQLHKCVSTFGSLYPNSSNFEEKTDNECSFAHNQHETIKCIWQQKVSSCSTLWCLVYFRKNET